MRWLTIPKTIASLLVAALAAAALVGINEVSFRQSTAAVTDLREAHLVRNRVNLVFRYLLDAETGQRGYLLTGDAKYLEPYDVAVANIGKATGELREFVARNRYDAEIATVLDQAASRKLTEMELTVKMRKSGNEDAWKFVFTTDVGREEMEVIRVQTDRLLEASMQRTAVAYGKIEQTLQLSRIGIALVASVGLLAFYLYLRQKNVLEESRAQEQERLQAERDRLESQVQERTATLAELATNLQQAREEERARLARELHDELGSLLTAAKLDVSRLKARLGIMSDEVQERMRHLVETLNSGIALKRRIIEDLRPSSLSNLGLKAALEILTTEFAQRSGVSMATNFEDVELDASKQLTVYRMVQEALTNIAKYAQAGKIEVLLQANRGHVTVSVKDDGVGFDPKVLTTSSHGLAGMRHRVFSEGGRLHVQSAPGSGTRISAVMPVSQATPQAAQERGQPGSGAEGLSPAPA